MQIQYISVWICVTGWTALPVNSNNVVPPPGKINNFQYVNAPAYHHYEFAFNRGSSEHQISRHEQVKDGNFQAKVKWSDINEGVGGSYYDYNHGNIGSSNMKSNYEYQPIQYYQQQRIPEYKSEGITANSEYQPDYADFEEKIDDVIQPEDDDEAELSSEEPIKSYSSSNAVAAALIQIPQKKIENLFRLPTLSVAQHLLNVYSLVEQQ